MKDFWFVGLFYREDELFLEGNRNERQRDREIRGREAIRREQEQCYREE